MIHFLLVSAALGFGDAAIENPLAKDLVTKGLVLPQGPVQLPAPVLGDGLSKAQQVAAADYLGRSR